MREIKYDREKAVAYAKEWAFKRNPQYYDFENIGGDCTNFASQCIYAGCGIMNYSGSLGWYYNTLNDRAAAWTGVKYLYNFLIGNKGIGPYAEEIELRFAQPGDIIQLGETNGHYYHSPVVVAVTEEEIYVAAHTYNAFMRPLSSYIYDRARLLHIIAARSRS